MTDSAKSKRKHKLLKELFIKTIAYIALSIGGIIMVLPFVWTVSTSLKMPGMEFSYPPEWIPKPVTLNNYGEIFERLPFAWFFINSTKISIAVTSGQLFVCSLAAYAFSKLKFRGRDAIFLLLLSTMMVPIAVRIIPEYLMMLFFGWIETHWPLIVPPILTGAYGTFLLRQFFITIPDELADAARMDGCNSFQIYYKIILPLSKAALATLAIITFMNNWNDFLRPLIYISDAKRMTVQLGLTYLSGEYGIQWRWLAAGTTASIIPIIILFLFLQKHFVKGVVLSGLKG